MDLELERTARLIEEARGGRREASEELFRTYGEVLEKAMKRRLRDAPSPRFDTSDIVQEALADAVAHFGDFEHRGQGSFRRWLLRILENRLRMALHREHAQKRDSRQEVFPTANRGPRSETSPASALAASVTSPSAAASAEEERERIEGVLARLSPDHAEVIRLVKMREMTITAAARRMGRTENAVKKLRARALLAMRAELGSTPPSSGAGSAR